MKKVIIVLLAASSMLVFSCGGGKDSKNDSAGNTSTNEANTNGSPQQSSNNGNTPKSSEDLCSCLKSLEFTKGQSKEEIDSLVQSCDPKRSLEDIHSLMYKDCHMK